MKAMEKWPASDGIILRYIHGYTAVPGAWIPLNQNSLPFVRDKFDQITSMVETMHPGTAP